MKFPPTDVIVLFLALLSILALAQGHPLASSSSQGQLIPLQEPIHFIVDDYASFSSRSYPEYAEIEYPSPTSTVLTSSSPSQVAFQDKFEYPVGGSVSFGSCGSLYCSMTLHDNVNTWSVYFQMFLAAPSGGNLQVYVNGVSAWTVTLATGRNVIQKSGLSQVWNLGDTISMYVGGSVGTNVTYIPIYGGHPFPPAMYFREA
jgi:hypothetical protein